MKNKLMIVMISVILISAALSGCKDRQVEEVGSIAEFSDLRLCSLNQSGISLRDMDLIHDYKALLTATFDTNTPWPPAEWMPEGFHPEEIIEFGMNPGLRIRELHEMGITGEGVHVAIIDQPLLLTHKEYQNQLVQYNELVRSSVSPQMHASAVSSLLVGESCGVAPKAALHFWSEPSWEKTYKHKIEALDQIMEYNQDKPLAEQIRVVSISLGYNDYDQLELWKEKIKEVEEAGIIVVHCSDEGNESFFGVGCKVFEDQDDVNNYELCTFIQRDQSRLKYSKNNAFIYVPIDNRTVAGFEGDEDYAFFAEGGLSWGAPYIAGVIALGLQVDPQLTREEIYEYIWETGTEFNNGIILNPVGFINRIKQVPLT